MPVSAGATGRQEFSFDLVPSAYRAAQLACYDSGGGAPLTLARQESNQVTRIAMRLPDWGAGRRKINCTAPSSQVPGVFYWYSQMWLVRQANGEWYAE